MGEFRKYRPYYACNALRFNASETVWYSSGNKDGAMTRVPEFQDIGGTEYGWLLNLNSMNMTYHEGDNTTISYPAQGSYPAISDQVSWGTAVAANYQHFVYLTPFATTDKLADYDMDDYDYRSTKQGITYFQRMQFVASNVNKILYSMSIFNGNTDSYVVNDDTTFAPDTFYALIDGNYILLTEEPSNWSTNYTDYYKILHAEDIKISCIKFRKIMAASSNSSRSYANAIAGENNQTARYVLYCAYFLDEEITIHPGDSYLLSLSFESSQF